MKIREIILEYNLKNLIDLFNEKYREKQKSDHSNQYETLETFTKSIEEPLRKEGKFQFIEPYMKWIVQRYVTGKLGKYEDIESKVIPGLLKYDGLKRKNKLQPEHKDINLIKNIDQFLDVLDHYREEETLSGKEKEKEIERKFYEIGEAELVYNDNKYKIIIPKSERASCFFGRNTRWCTAATQGKNYFQDYNKKGDLYIILIKKENKRFQLHFQTKQFMDEKDQRIDFRELFQEMPDLEIILQNLVKKRKIKTSYFKDPQRINDKDIQTIVKNGNFSYVIHLMEKNPNLLTDENIKFILNEEPSFIEKIIEIGKFSEDKKIEYITHNSITMKNYLISQAKKNLDFLKNPKFYELAARNNKVADTLIFFIIDNRVIQIRKYITQDILDTIFKIIEKRSYDELNEYYQYFMSTKNSFLLGDENSKKIFRYVFMKILDDYLEGKNIKLNPTSFLQMMFEIRNQDDVLRKRIDSIFLNNPEIFKTMFREQGLNFFGNFSKDIIYNYLHMKNEIKDKNSMIGFILGTVLPEKYPRNEYFSFLETLKLMEIQTNWNILNQEDVMKIFKTYAEKDFDNFVKLFSFLNTKNLTFENLTKIFLSEKNVINLKDYIESEKFIEKISNSIVSNWFRGLDKKTKEYVKDNFKNLVENFPLILQ